MLAAGIVAGTIGTQPSRVDARQTVTIDSEPSCADCLIRLDTLVVLGDREGEGYVSRPFAVQRLTTGEWLVAHSVNPAQITVFDSSGHFLRYVGRSGAGPGEYRWITSVDVGAGDTIRIYDVGLLRLTVLNGSFELLETYQLGLKPPNAMLPVGRDSLLVAVEVPTVERLGYPLHIVDLEGTVLRSFGAENPVYRADKPRLIWRSVDWAGPREVWSAPLMRYVIERWDLDGHKRGEIVRRAEWFPPHEDFGFNGDDPPNPGLLYIRQDDRGYLWTMVHVAGKDWKTGTGIVRRPGSLLRAGITDYEKYLDTIIEVIDPDAGRLVTSQRFPHHFMRFASDDVVIGYHEDELGYPTILVAQVQLLRNGGS